LLDKQSNFITRYSSKKIYLVHSNSLKVN